MSLQKIKVPDLGGASEVVVIEVLVAPGDALTADTPIVTLESDKATLDVPSGKVGVVKEVKVKVGDKIGNDAVLLTFESSEKEAAQPKKETPKEKTETKIETKPDIKAEAKKEAKKEVAQPTPSPKKEEAPVEYYSANGEVHAGPAVRRIAREFGVDLTQVKGRGFKERILKEDVQAYVKSKLAQIASGGGGFQIPIAPVVDFSKFGAIETQALSRIKKLSGKHLHRNWVTIPHVTQFDVADITDLDQYRKSSKPRLEKEGVKLTPLVFIMKAVVECLKKFPTFNASLDANGENLILKKYFHIGVAVDTPEGLVVPVIKDVNHKKVTTLAKELASISEKARQKQLLPGEMQGGCFSISSLGGIGGTAFTPIINAPEVAILGVSKASFQPIYAPENNQFEARLMLPLSLSYDHRVIDGAEAARFIVYLSDLLADVRHLLL